MRPWLRVLIILLAALSTRMARAQQEQPRSIPPPPSAAERIDELEERLALLQGQLDALSSAAHQAAQQDTQVIAQLQEQVALAQRGLEATQQQLAATVARGQALEQNRLSRAASYGEVNTALLNASLILSGGSDEVGGLLDAAARSLERASEDAAALGNGDEAASGQSALGNVSDALYALSQRNLFGARAALLGAIQDASAANAAAQDYSQPLYSPAP